MLATVIKKVVKKHPLTADFVTENNEGKVKSSVRPIRSAESRIFYIQAFISFHERIIKREARFTHVGMLPGCSTECIPKWPPLIFIPTQTNNLQTKTKFTKM